MADETTVSSLELLKLDLGVKNTSKDVYYNSLLATAQKELEKKGITLDKNSVEDAMLVSDYAAWCYRKRTENVPLPVNLQLRIRNRIVSARARRKE